MQKEIKNEGIQKPKSFLKEKIMRFKIVVFVRKNIFVFSILSLFLLSLLLGIWNIKRYEVVDMDGEDVGIDVEQEIGEYFDNNIFLHNYFIFSPKQYQESMYSEIANLKSVRIEKIIPNKIILFVQTHTPKYVADINPEECFVLSPEGFVLEVLSKEGPEVAEGEEREVLEGLCVEYAQRNNLALFSSNNVEISVLNDKKRKLLLMEDINKVVEVIEAFKYEVVNITLENDILKVVEVEGRLFTFSMAEDLDNQLKRYIIVVGKIKNDLLEFASLDVRFERPVMKE